MSPSTHPHRLNRMKVTKNLGTNNDENNHPSSQQKKNEDKKKTKHTTKI